MLKNTINEDIVNSISNLQISKKRKNINKDAIIYARCSTQLQTHSLQTQISICIDYCKDNNFNIINIYKDIQNGHNITKLQIYSIADNYKDISIIIADPSRLSRSISNTVDFIEKCNNVDIKLHFVRDNLTTESNQDIKQIINLTCDAYIETQILSKRLKTTFETKKKNGSMLGKVPFGMELYTEMNQINQILIRKFKPNHTEQQIIKLINMMYFGCNNMNDFYNVYSSLTNNTTYIMKELDNKEFEQIYYGNFTKRTIMEFLNDNQILNRNNTWSISMIDNILSNSNDFPVNKLLTIVN